MLLVVCDQCGSKLESVCAKCSGAHAQPISESEAVARLVHARGLAVAALKAKPGDDFLTGRVAGFESAIEVLRRGADPAAESLKAPREKKPTPAILRDTKPAKSAPARPPASTTNGAAVNPALSPCERAILTVLAQRGKPTSRDCIAVRAGYSASSGGFGQALANLRAARFIYDVGPDGPGLSITYPGEQALGAFDPLPTGDALLKYWQAKVNPCAAAILEQLAIVYPNEMRSREDLAEVTGYSATSGGFGQALADLRQMRLVDGLKATPELMGSS